MSERRIGGWGEEGRGGEREEEEIEVTKRGRKGKVEGGKTKEREIKGEGGDKGEKIIISPLRSSKQRWLKLSSAYAESPLRVGCLEWPLRVSPAHSLQLQSTAALKALNPIKSRHAQVGMCRGSLCESGSL